mgnify:CR=1 FL=1
MSSKLREHRFHTCTTSSLVFSLIQCYPPQWAYNFFSVSQNHDFVQTCTMNEIPNSVTPMTLGTLLIFLLAFQDYHRFPTKKRRGWGINNWSRAWDRALDGRWAIGLKQLKWREREAYHIHKQESACPLSSTYWVSCKASTSEPLGCRFEVTGHSTDLNMCLTHKELQWLDAQFVCTFHSDRLPIMQTSGKTSYCSGTTGH